MSDGTLGPQQPLWKSGKMSSNSYLLRMYDPSFLTLRRTLLIVFFVFRTPEHTFDIHVLRTFTRDLNGWIVRLQSTAPDASETINQVIYALNLTFRDVELSYRVWRNDRVQSVLRHGNFFFFFLSEGGMKPTLPHVAGFLYARDRIQAALWRRERGRPAAIFPAIYPAFQFSGVPNPSPERQPSSLPLAQGDASFYQPNTNTYVPAGPSTASWASPQPQSAQLYQAQNNTYPRRSEPTPAQSPQLGSVTGFSPGPGFGQEGITARLNEPPYYPPPPHPPANWRPPDPVPGSPPVPAAAAGAVEVAIRYLEAVNKAINICVDFNAM